MIPVSQRTVLLALALLPVALSGCSDQKDMVKVEADLDTARNYAEMGEISDAKRWVDQAIAVDPKRMATYVGVDPSTEDDGEDEGQTDSIASIFADDVHDDSTLIHYMRMAIAVNPKDYRPYTFIVDAESRTGDVAAREADATALAGLLEKRMTTPGTLSVSNLQYLLGSAYFDAGNPEKGKETLNRAILVSGDANTMNTLAYEYAVYNRTTDLKQALSLATEALVKLPSDEDPGPVLDTLGWVQYRMGDYKNAMINIEKAIATQPRIPELRYHLAMIYLALGRTDDARVEFAHALVVDPEYADALREQAKFKGAPPPSPSVVLPEA